MPDLIRLLRVARDHGAHEALDGALLGFVAEKIPDRDPDKNRERHAADDVAQRF